MSNIDPQPRPAAGAAIEARAAPGGVLPVLVSEILEALPVAVLVVDARQRIREFNAEASRLFGYRREQLLGAPLDCLLPESVRASHAEWVRRFAERPEPRSMGSNRDLLARRADGSLVPVEIALKPIRTGDELFVIAAVLDISARKALEQRVLADKAELERQVRERTAELERLTREDPLTGLANRREFDARLALEHDRAVRHELPLSVAMLDLDWFKRVNDAWGHAIGDEVLRHVAAILRAQCRTVDLPARYGGEEFVIALPDTSLLEAKALCERIRIAVQEHDWPAIQPGLALTISIGVAMREPVDTAQALVEAADQALYEAKHGGRNRVAIRANGIA
jgi:diguanylate cyclase (GGDEF)-like protein/PAS domain S-box-containing protein